MSAPRSADLPALGSDTIALLPRTLMWVTGGGEFENVQLRHAERVSKALTALLARIRIESPELAESISNRLAHLSEESLDRVLLSPSVSQRLLWGSESVAASGQFLERCLAMEAATGVDNMRYALPVWGALGNCVLRKTGETSWEPVGDRLPVDLESPDEIALGPTMPSEAVGWMPLSLGEQQTALETLTAAYLRTRTLGRSLPALIDICSRVVVMRKRQARLFNSFSSCYSVGRIVLVNPHLVKEPLIAEALVHEAIHNYLYMQDSTPLWGLKPGVSEEPEPVHSPWTGRPLPFCTFLHACFVWYGLFFFWGKVMSSSNATLDEARRGFARASSGFMKGSILEQVGDVKMRFVRDELGTALAEMQRNVLGVIG